MGRFQAGFTTGIVGAIIATFLGLETLKSVFNALILLLAVVIGIIAAIIVVRGPKFKGKGAGVGSVAGLIAGAFYLIGVLAAGFVYLQTPAGQNVISTAQSIIDATATAAPSGSSIPANSGAYITFGIYFGITFIQCFFGVLSIGLATGAGAITGLIAKQKVAPAANQASFYQPMQGYNQMPGSGQAPQPPIYPQQPPGYGSSTMPQNPQEPQPPQQ